MEREAQIREEEKAAVTQLFSEHVDVFKRLWQLYPDKDDAKRWIFAPHPLLAGDSPAQRMYQGHMEDVISLIDQLETGIYLWHES